MSRVTTGVNGLDYVLGGGLMPGSCVLVSGQAGTGKTTLGLHFLHAGAALGEGGVYVTFEEFPEQIYRDAAAVGLDLKSMEDAGKLQVVSMSPDIFLDEAQAVDGLLHELRAEVGMQRIVIDSLTLMHQAADASQSRSGTYILRNALRRMDVTALLLEERSPDSEAGTLDEFVVDTVLHLTFDNLDGHRLRHLEVRKHRGSGFQAGQHIFVVTPQGMRTLPALNRIPDLQTGEVVPTGLPLLDQYLGGGIPRGSSFALNVNSKCNYRYLLGAIMAGHLQVGDGLISGRSALYPPAEVARLLQLYGYDAGQLGAAGRWAGLDLFERPAPAELAPHIVHLPAEIEAHQRAAEEAIMGRWLGEIGSASHWLWTVDMNTVLRAVGEEGLVKEWSGRIAAARHYGHTVIAVCNFEEMGASMASFVQRTASGILRTWFDGRYQYLQVQKAPNGRMSEPMVIEYTEEPPYMALW